jgi:hypothetical protein
LTIKYARNRIGAMNFQPTDLRDIVRLLLQFQAAIPTLFLAGLIASTSSFGDAAKKAIENAEQNKGHVLDAVGAGVRAERVKILGAGIVAGLFVITTGEVWYYLNQVNVTNPDSLMNFMNWQMGLYLLTAGTGALFAFMVRP